MIRHGLLNPAVLSLLARVRHTNTVVLADRGFPFCPGLETIDLSLVDDVPTVRQVLDAILPRYVIGRIFAAEEFRQVNPPAVFAALRAQAGSIPLVFEPHADLKRRVSSAIGLIRTGDSLPYANLILESA